MPIFETKFNYPLYFCLLIISIVFCSLLLGFLLAVPQIIQDEGLLTGAGIMLAGLLMFGYFSAQSIETISTIRYGIIITENKIILKG